MTTIDMDKHFDNYLESNEYDEAEGMLLSMIRRAYFAGWNAAMQEAAQASTPDQHLTKEP